MKLLPELSFPPLLIAYVADYILCCALICLVWRGEKALDVALVSDDDALE